MAQPKASLAIKGCLATLELVKDSGRDGSSRALSNDEAEAAHLDLEHIIKTAESIKAKLPSSLAIDEASEITSASENDVSLVARAASLAQHEKIRVDNPVNEPSGVTDDNNEQPQRRHSTDNGEQSQRRRSIGVILDASADTSAPLVSALVVAGQAPIYSYTSHPRA